MYGVITQKTTAVEISDPLWKTQAKFIFWNSKTFKQTEINNVPRNKNEYDFINYVGLSFVEVPQTINKILFKMSLTKIPIFSAPPNWRAE
jgi:hypothetical protein